MSYISSCKINPKLFKEFQSKKKIIKPQLSDDWEVIPVSYNNRTDVTLKSKKLNLEIAGTNIYSLFDMLQYYKTDLREGKYIQGMFIIGSDRKLYSEKDYNEWIKEYGNIVDGKIKAKDLKLGKGYIFKCASKGYFLGIDRDEKNKPIYLFIQYLEEENRFISIVRLTDLKKIAKEDDDDITKFNNYKQIVKYFISEHIGCILSRSYENTVLSKIAKPHLVYNEEIIDKDYFPKDTNVPDYKRSWDFYVYRLSSNEYKVVNYLTKLLDPSICSYEIEIRNNKLCFNNKCLSREIFVYIIENYDDLPKNIKLFKI